jgi:hypothetical protein
MGNYSKDLERQLKLESSNALSSTFTSFI